MRTVGEHILRLVAVMGTLTASLYSQPPAAGPFVCSDVLGDKTCNSDKNDGRFRRPGLADISLTAWNQQNSQADQQDEKSSAAQGSPKHIFLVVPAFHVAYLKTFKPLTPRDSSGKSSPATARSSFGRPTAESKGSKKV